MIQLLQDEGNRFPLVKDVIDRDIYIDDIVSSLMRPDQTFEASQELVELFIAGGFQLAKWSSNSKEVLEHITEASQISQSADFNKDDTIQILDLRWIPSDDVFPFKVALHDKPCTRRYILSSVHHYLVKGSENPSDCLSRGLILSQFVNHPLWLYEARRISLPRKDWSTKLFVSNNLSEVQELKPVSLVTTTPDEPFLYKVASGFSSWKKLLKTLYYIYKYIKKLPPDNMISSYIVFAEQEINRTNETGYFSKEIHKLKNDKPCSATYFREGHISRCNAGQCFAFALASRLNNSNN